MKKQIEMFHVADLDDGRNRDEAWFPLLTGALLTIGNQWSANTKNAYHYGLRSWHDFAREFGEPTSMPPRPRAVVAWLHYLAEQKGMARASINLRLAGLAWADRWSRSVPSGEDDAYSLLHHPLIRAWKRGHARESRARVRDPMPPTQDEIRALIAGCMVARPRKGPYRTPMLAARDRALILLLYYAAMRKSELVALTVGDVISTSRGIEIMFQRSKTDQSGEGESRAIFPQDEAMLCAVHAWNAWLAVYHPSSPASPAFVGVSHGGTRLTPKAIGYENIKKVLISRCKDAGIRRLSPHQLRAALATHAAEKNDEGEIAFHGRWRSRSTMDRYIKRGRTWKKNPTVGLMR